MTIVALVPVVAPLVTVIVVLPFCVVVEKDANAWIGLAAFAGATARTTKLAITTLVFIAYSHIL
jgi:hypothetical protein